MDARARPRRRPFRLRPRGASARPRAASSRSFNYGRGREGLIPLWVGEGDLPTPAFIARGGGAGRSRRRDLLHLAARHPGTARGASPATTSALLRRGPSTRSGSSSPSAACRRSRSRCASSRARATRCWSRPRPGRTSSARSRVGGRRARRRCPMARRPGRAGARPRPARGRRDAAHPRHRASTRPPTRPAGPRRATTSRAILRSRAGTACGSSPTRSTAASSTSRRSCERAGRTPSFRDVMERRTTASCSSRPSPRTGR